MTNHSSASEAVERIIESAQRLGVEVDEEEAIQWLTAMAAVQNDDIVVDVDTGVFGHTVTMLDFSPSQLARYRHFADIVQLEDQPNVETAIALSGSAAQSKIQSYPGDCDYFERVNILAPTREEACAILGDVMRQKALDTLEGPDYRLIEVKFGSYPEPMTRNGKRYDKGSPISWRPSEIQAGYIKGESDSGEPVRLKWEAVQDDPGWCKMDWVVADPENHQLANASNMLDVTWETPDGGIVPLDGYLDPYFQEVYLEADSVPLFSKLARQLNADSLTHYVSQLEGEVAKYVNPPHPNYGKAAKRMYNIFRLTGRYSEAAFLRELFDEPATILYQVYSLITTLDNAAQPGSSMPMDQVLSQADDLILTVVRTLEGADEVDIVRNLLALKDALRDAESGRGLSDRAEEARAGVIRVVNDFFQTRLALMPAIEEYMGQFIEQMEELEEALEEGLGEE